MQIYIKELVIPNKTMDKINKITVNNITYEIGGGGSATVDSGLSTTSENAVQNKVITSELEKKLDKSNFQATLNSVVAKYNNFGGAYLPHDGRDYIKLMVEYTGATYTDEVTDKEQLCKIVGYTGDTSIPNADTGLYVIFKASDLEYLKNTFPNRTFNVNVCNVPDDGYDTHELYSIYQDIGSGKAMRGKQYVMPMGMNMGYTTTNLLDWNNPSAKFDVTFESLYATYSGDTSTMFFTPWEEIRDAFETSSSPSCEINGDSNSHTVYIYSSSKVSYYTMNGERTGFYVKFIERSDFNGNVTINLQHSMDYLYNSSDFDNIKTDISKNKSQIGYLKRDVVYAEPDIADSAHTFTKTINGEKLYTTDKDHRDIKTVTSVNGKTGSVNLIANVNGQNIIGGSINVYGDWNINDTSNTHYIHNRPFYQEDPTDGDPIYLFKGTDYSQCYCTNTTLQKDIAEGVLEAPFQDYTCYKEGNKYVIKKTEHISNPPSYAYGYWDGSGITSGSSWSSHVANAGGPDDMRRYAQNNFYFRPKIDGVIHKLDNKFIQAKTINGESVLGEGEIDMSSYQTKTEAVKIARLTQAQYDALSTKDNNTLYIITDAQ